MIDWSKCPDAESVPEKLGGAWCIKGTRIPVQAIIDNAADASPSEIAEMFELPVDLVQRILEFADHS
jgi:uncharacterized protein (DUF433 family)